MAKWHQFDATSEAWVAPVISILPKITRISGSGSSWGEQPSQPNNIKAKKIRTEEDGDLAISFTIRERSSPLTTRWGSKEEREGEEKIENGDEVNEADNSETVKKFSQSSGPDVIVLDDSMLSVASPMSVEEVNQTIDLST